MVKIVLSQNQNIDFKKSNILPKYILTFTYKNDKLVKPSSFVFSNKNKLIQFYNVHQNEDIDFTISEINEVDPINVNYKIHEEKYENWKIRN